MANYFYNFPTTYYINTDENTDLDVVTDITKRIGFEEEFKKNSAAYFKIVVTDDDTPEILAHKFYSDVEKHWIILMMNDIIDAQFDWPMKEPYLYKFIESKYANNSSPGVEPFVANSFTQKTLTGSFNVRNKNLVKVLETKGKNTEDIWSSITTNEGSVQHLNFLDEHEKMVFKTAQEIDQRW
jgi:hypothetical protein